MGGPGTSLLGASRIFWRGFAGPPRQRQWVGPRYDPCRSSSLVQVGDAEQSSDTDKSCWNLHSECLLSCHSQNWPAMGLRPSFPRSEGLITRTLAATTVHPVRPALSDLLCHRGVGPVVSSGPQLAGGTVRRKTTNGAFARQVLRPIRGTTWSRLLEVLSSITSLVLFVGAVVGLHEHSPAWAIVLVVWFAILATTAFGLLWLQEHRAWRRTRYAAAVDEVHGALHAIRDGAAALLLRDASATDVIDDLANALTALASAFTIITGQKCRATIKEVSRARSETGAPVVIDPHDDDQLRGLEVTTMARSSRIETQADHLRHFVDQNTDFESLFKNPGQRWFVSNNLMTLEHYKNSSWHGDGPRDYQSTCVWPIQKRDAFGNTKHDILGFLCVDSQGTGIFDERFDFWVGAGIADALYPVLKMLHRQAEGIRYVPDVGKVV